MMHIKDICQHLPHRYPMLLVDRVVELETGSHVHAYKNITYNEEVFQGHFPGEPVFPGVLIVEAMTQISALLGFNSLGITIQDDMVCYLTGVDNCRFRRPVVPGDTLHLYSTLKRHRSNMGFFDTYATVDDTKCCEGKIMCLYQTK